MKTAVLDIYQQHRYLLDSEKIYPEEKKKINDILFCRENEVELKRWYDGYVIGNTEVYNPWSVLNYLNKKQLVPYWINTSSNDLIKLILKNSYTIKEQIERLLKDEEIEVKVDQE